MAEDEFQINVEPEPEVRSDGGGSINSNIHVHGEIRNAEQINNAMNEDIAPNNDGITPPEHPEQDIHTMHEENRDEEENRVANHEIENVNSFSNKRLTFDISHSENHFERIENSISAQFKEEESHIAVTNIEAIQQHTVTEISFTDVASNDKINFKDDDIERFTAGVEKLNLEHVDALKTVHQVNDAGVSKGDMMEEQAEDHLSTVGENKAEDDQNDVVATLSNYSLDDQGSSSSSESSMQDKPPNDKLLGEHITEISKEDEAKQGEAFQSILHELQDEHLRTAESEDIIDDSIADYAEGDTQDVVLAKHDRARCFAPQRSPLLRDSLKELNVAALPDVLNICWTFGFNASNPVHSVVTDSMSSVFYTSSHTGVVYDYGKNQQTLLRGHSNTISCCCASANKRWLVTGDLGPNSLLIVWDSSTYMPVRTIFDCHAERGGVVACALSADSRFLATLGDNIGGNQRIAVWDWTTESEEPICTADILAAHGRQNYILFNPKDNTEIVTNSQNQVLFYSWKTGEMEYFAPPLSDTTFNRAVGRFTQSIFFSGQTSRALSATDNGNVVIWDSNKPHSAINANEEQTPNKKALKMIKLLEHGISCVTYTDDLIVIGDIRGKVRFFEQGLTMIHMYSDLHVYGPISSVSFEYQPDFHMFDHRGGKYPTNSTLQGKPFIVRDFTVSTSTGVIALVRVNGTDVKILRKEHDAPVCALSAHPSLPLLTIGSYSGWLQVWQYTKRVVVASRKFDKGLQIQSCSYDPLGQVIALGFTDGSIRVVDAFTLKDVTKQYRFKDYPIIHVVFSHNSEYFATADTNSTVTLFRKGICEKIETNAYTFVGRYKSHFKPIRDIRFGVNSETGELRLLSIGDDRMLVEYDLKNSLKFTENLNILSTDRIEQSAIPCCMTWYPVIGKESFIVVANTEYKLKLYNSMTKMCRKKVLGPTIGSPISRLEVLCPPAQLGAVSKSGSRNTDESKYYMAFLNHDKVGVIKIPLDGNPHSFAAFIAHPQGASNLATSYDGRFVFTAGGEDSSVHMWAFNPFILEGQARLAGKGVKPFYSLLEGGQEGPEFHDIEQLFYYAQIKNQGISSSKTREVGMTVAVSELPDMMRALGYYPTQEEIDEMLTEVRFKSFVETGEYTTRINLGDFIKLYINHRPAFGVEMDQLHWAFDVLASHCSQLQREGSSLMEWSARDGSQSHRSSGSAPQSSQAEAREAEIERDDLLYLLQNYGERLSGEELVDSLAALLGQRSEGGLVEGGCVPPPPIRHDSDPMEQVEEALPLTFTAASFTNSLLAMKFCQDKFY